MAKALIMIMMNSFPRMPTSESRCRSRIDVRPSAAAVRLLLGDAARRAHVRVASKRAHRPRHTRAANTGRGGARKRRRSVPRVVSTRVVGSTSSTASGENHAWPEHGRGARQPAPGPSHTTATASVPQGPERRAGRTSGYCRPPARSRARAPAPPSAWGTRAGGLPWRVRRLPGTQRPGTRTRRRAGRS